MTINYPACIEYLYPNIQNHEYSLRDNGEGVFIEAWSYREPQPTLEQLVMVNEKATLQFQLKYIRQERNRRLTETDWTQVVDSPVQAEWKQYRQALRDFPANCDPANPVWPAKPTAVKTDMDEAERVRVLNEAAKREIEHIAAFYAEKIKNPGITLEMFNQKT